MRTTLVTIILLLLFTNINAQFGTIDSSFGVNGKITSSLYYAYATNVVVQKNGKIVAGGSYFDGFGDYYSHFYITRFRENGILDKSFGNQGSATPNIRQQFAAVNDLTLQTDGKILAAGYIGYVSGTPQEYT